jgi:hypothetical protein
MYAKSKARKSAGHISGYSNKSIIFLRTYKEFPNRLFLFRAFPVVRVPSLLGGHPIGNGFFLGNQNKKKNFVPLAFLIGIPPVFPQ